MLNNGPASLARHLPSAWQARLQIVFTGQALLLRCLGRDDLIRSKLFALRDRGIDLADCIALAPTADELATILLGSSSKTPIQTGPPTSAPLWPMWQGGSAMPFSRAVAPVASLEPDVLTAAMVGIGMNFAAPAARDPNIDDTLLFASMEGMENDDLRVVDVLVTWFGIHASWVNVDRMTRLVSGTKAPRVRALWSALARWQSKDRRFARLANVYSGPRLDLLATGTAFQVKRHGEDERLAGGPFRVPANVLRNRQADVLTPPDLAKRHSAYRLRIMIGPSYRADMWAELEKDPGLSAAELARRTYGSFATAWHIRRDFGLLLTSADSSDRHGGAATR